MMRFWVGSNLYRDGIEVGIGRVVRDLDGKAKQQAATLMLNDFPEGDYMDPTMRLSADEAKELMDGLWRVGVRPSSGEGNAGQLGATEKHLADMRRLVFDLKAPE